MKNNNFKKNMMKIHDNVIEKLNNEIGKDIKNLNKTKFIIQKYKKQFDEIEKKLNVDNDELTSIVKDGLKKEKLARQTILIENDKIQNFENKLDDRILEYDNILNGINPFLKNIKYLEHMVEYLKIIEDIKEINHDLTLAIKNNKDDSKIIGYFLSLCGEKDSCNSITGRLQNVNAKYLKDYANKSSEYWYNILKNKFSNDFKQILKNIKWAHQEQLLQEINPSKELLDKLISLSEYLFLIKSPTEEDNNENLIMITPSIVCPSISTTVTLLIKPFRQKFYYHFTGPRQTNRLDKPEWYFTQILNWAKSTHLFVGKYFQSAAIKAGYKNLNIRLEYVRGLVQLCIEKLSNDIEEISKDVFLFAHLIDEILAFESELKESLSYPNGFPNVIDIITQPKYLLKWISIEEQFCTDKMDLLLQSNNSWALIEPSGFEDLKIPKCADQFVRLLDAIKERYSSLNQPGHKLQFLNLQLELIDNFRRRLVQLYVNGNISTTKILNAINYINFVLREWGENVHYLHLHAALIGPNVNEIFSVFEQPICELEHWKNQLLEELSCKIVDEIKAKSMLYRHDNWSNMSERNSKEPFMLSVTAGEMFQLMVTTFHNLEKKLSLNLLVILLRMIAHQLDDFFLHNLVMNTKFSIGGASQFQFDMTRNLFPIFGQFITHYPHLLFKKIHDACILLNIPQGNALLLCQTIKSDITDDQKIKALREIGIINLNPKYSLIVLERRINLRIY